MAGKPVSDDAMTFEFSSDSDQLFLSLVCALI